MTDFQRSGLCFIFWCSVIMFVVLPHGSAFSAEQFLTAPSYIVANRRDGKILIAENAKTKRAPASTTKLLTALLVTELASPKDVVSISRQAVQTLPVRIGLKAGECFTVNDLLTAALVRSANDCCVALAEHVAGTEEHFVELMNQKAELLGATDSLFANSHGLPGGEQYTTAYDMLIIVNAFRESLYLADLLSTKQSEIHSQEGRVLQVFSRNRILKEDSYDFFIGKTGYTRDAGYCLVGVVDQDQSEIVFSLLGSRSLWQDARTLLEMGISLN